MGPISKQTGDLLIHFFDLTTAYIEMTYDEMFAEEEEEDSGNLVSKLDEQTMNKATPQTIPPHSAFFIFSPTNK